MKDSELPQICFATHNRHKSEEVGAMLSGKYRILNLEDLDLKGDIPETGNTLEENSAIKAHFLYDTFHIDCFADDSGLEVEALNGAPGVRSARYAGEPKDDNRNIDLLIRNLRGISNRKARFRTVITLIYSGNKRQFEGIVNGKIIDEKKGKNGFGYDPVFVPEGFQVTFAEMSAEQKNGISHRGKAILKLTHFLKDNLSIQE